MFCSCKTKIVVFLAAIFFIGQSVSIGQEKNFPQSGLIELSGSIAYANYSLTFQGQKEETTSIISFSPQVGYFLTKNFEIGLSTGVVLLPGLSFQSQGGNNISALQLFATPSYYFLLDESNLTPFVEAQLGYTSLAASGENSVSRSGFSYGGRAGIKFVPVEHIIFTLAGQYLSINLKPAGETERTGYNYFTIGVGVGVYF